MTSKNVICPLCNQSRNMLAENFKRRKSDMCLKCYMHQPKSEEHKRKLGIAHLGNRNSQWKGNKVGYVSMHNWVRRHKPKPELCEDCQLKPPMDLANISQKYKRDLNDFEWICRKCHMIKDKRRKNLIERNKDGRIYPLTITHY